MDFAAFADELQKLAASRVDKEIAAGRLQYHDFLPHVPQGQVPGFMEPVFKRQMRSEFHAPAAVPADQLARRRALNARVGVAQAAHPDLPGVKVHDEVAPGMGVGYASGNVFAPKEGPRMVRSLTENSPATGQAKFVFAATAPREHPLRERAMAAPHPMDPTVQRGLQQHELGEHAEALRLGAGRPAAFNASHLGTEPILRESQAVQGDPDAVGTFRKLRSMHPDDAYVQKKLRSVGATPDHPVPLGGKQHRALDRILSRSAPQLSPQTRGKALGVAVSQGLPVSYLNPGLAQKAKGLTSEAEALVKGGLPHSLRDAATAAGKVKSIWQRSAPVRSWLSTGR